MAIYDYVYNNSQIKLFASHKQFLQFASFCHFRNDVETSDKVAFDDELRIRGPLVERLQS